MEHLRAPAVVSWPITSCALGSLSGSLLADRFHAWVGASGRRYTVSVYPVDLHASDAGLPDFDGFVLIPVCRDGFSRVPLAIVGVEREVDRRIAVAEALAQGAAEWHVHLLAEDRASRRAAVADLSVSYGLGASVGAALSA